jgi:hypothetical protein
MSALIVTVSPAFAMLTADTAVFHNIDGTSKMGISTSKLRVWPHIGIAASIQGTFAALEAINRLMNLIDLPSDPGEALPRLASGTLASLLDFVRSNFEQIKNDPHLVGLSSTQDAEVGDLRMVMVGMWGDEPASIYVDTTNGDTPVRLIQGHTIVPAVPFSENSTIKEHWAPAAGGDLAAAESLHIALGRSIRASGLPVGGLLTSAQIDAGGICIRRLADLESPA